MHAVLRMCCPDRPGIVAELSNFVFRNRGNIVHLDQHVDAEANVFFARIEWTLERFLIRRDGKILHQKSGAMAHEEYEAILKKAL